MTKQQRKSVKRLRIASRIATQDQWIEHFGLDAPTSRRERDRRFTAVQQISAAVQGITGVAS